MERFNISISDASVQGEVRVKHTNFPFPLVNRVLAVPLPIFGCGHFDKHTVQFVPVCKTVLHKAPALLYGQAPVAFHNSVPFLLRRNDKLLDAVYLLIN